MSIVSDDFWIANRMWRTLPVYSKHLSRSRSDLSTQRRDRRCTTRMNGVRKNHDERIARRVHPKRSSGKACVAEAADGKGFAARSRKRRVDIPTESTRGNASRWFSVGHEDRLSSTGRLGLLGRGHQSQRRLL